MTNNINNKNIDYVDKVLKKNTTKISEKLYKNKKSISNINQFSKKKSYSNNLETNNLEIDNLNIKILENIQNNSNINLSNIKENDLNIDLVNNITNQNLKINDTSTENFKTNNSENLNTNQNESNYLNNSNLLIGTEEEDISCKIKNNSHCLIGLNDDNLTFKNNTLNNDYLYNYNNLTENPKNNTNTTLNKIKKPKQHSISNLKSKKEKINHLNNQDATKKKAIQEQNTISIKNYEATNNLIKNKILSNKLDINAKNYSHYEIENINNDSNSILLNSNLLYNFGTNIIPKTDLSGHIIVSSPNLSTDSLLSKTLIYIASHTATGAFGFILNNFIGTISWDTIVKNNNEVFKNNFVDMYYGGIEEQGKGFILHSQDYNSNVLFSSNISKINVSHNNEIINNIVYENKPKEYLFLTGCTLWKQGQLEKEMMSNFWVVLDPYLTRHFVFNPVKEEAWSLALNIIGINPNRYINKMGTD